VPFVLSGRLPLADIMLLSVLAAIGRETAGKTPGTASGRAGEARIVGVRVEDRRSTGEGAWSPEAQLRLRVLGRDAARASRWGRVAIDEAVDDKGTDIIAERPGAGPIGTGSPPSGECPRAEKTASS